MNCKEPLFYSFLHSDYAPQCIWNLFYSDKPEKTYTNEKNYNITTKNPEENSIFFFDCSFFDLSDGCIVIRDKDGLKFLHSFCRFSNNSRYYNWGGCIDFRGDMHIVQHRLCAYDIIPDCWSGFCYIELSGNLYYNKDNYNYFFENSLTKYNNPNEGCSIYLEYGLIHFSSTNSSGNYVSEHTGYYLHRASYPSIVNYSTFEGNKANTGILTHGYGFFTVTKSNILNNTCQNDGYLFSVAGSVEVIDCSFFGNNASVLFYLSDLGEFIVRNCSIDNFTQDSYYGGLTVSVESIDTNQKTFILSHYATHGCIAAYPQPINVNFSGIRYFLTVSEITPQTHSCKYRRFFRDSVKGKF